jgi:hypothetical protein
VARDATFLFLLVIMLADFTDLPLELLPAIFETIRRPSTLATICLVSRTIYNFTIPLLYERIFIYPWQKEGKRKVSTASGYVDHDIDAYSCSQVTRVFRTLAESPRLAAHVLRLGPFHPLRSARRMIDA